LVPDVKINHRLKILETKVLMKVFAPRVEEAVGAWRKLRNEEYNNLYSSPNIFTTIESMTMI
jgi:hypothetical protein